MIANGIDLKSESRKVELTNVLEIHEMEQKKLQN